MGGHADLITVLPVALGVDFAIQLVGWALAVALRTDVFYDITGSLTFVALANGSLLLASSLYPRQLLVTGMVTLWALRLGSFLLYRVSRSGGDSRFEEAKKSPLTFLTFWMLQGVWVFVTVLPLLLLNASVANPPLGRADAAGAVAWAAGFLIESIADWQKLRFKANAANRGRFIDVGLWRLARYPNYFGEILLWLGAWLAAAPALHGLELLSVLSPVAVAALLLGVSGVPPQERQARERWGDSEEYRRYRESTRLLLPLPKPGPQRDDDGL